MHKFMHMYMPMHMHTRTYMHMYIHTHAHAHGCSQHTHQDFDGTDTTIIKTDFASTAELKFKETQTCKHPTTANQAVALVLQSPKSSRRGKDRDVQCDY